MNANTNEIWRFAEDLASFGAKEITVRLSAYPGMSYSQYCDLCDAVANLGLGITLHWVAADAHFRRF